MRGVMRAVGPAAPRGEPLRLVAAVARGPFRRVADVRAADSRGDRRPPRGDLARADCAAGGAPGEGSGAAVDAAGTPAGSAARPRRGRGAARDDEGLALTATRAPIPR